VNPKSNPQNNFIDHERKREKADVNGRAAKWAHLACGFSLAQINRMQLAARGSGACPAAANALGARSVSAGGNVNQTVTVLAITAVESS
jgi:hypothetical protein